MLDYEDQDAMDNIARAKARDQDQMRSMGLDSERETFQAQAMRFQNTHGINRATDVVSEKNFDKGAMPDFSSQAALDKSKKKEQLLTANMKPDIAAPDAQGNDTTTKGDQLGKQDALAGKTGGAPASKIMDDYTSLLGRVAESSVPVVTKAALRSVMEVTSNTGLEKYTDKVVDTLDPKVKQALSDIAIFANSKGTKGEEAATDMASYAFTMFGVYRLTQAVGGAGLMFKTGKLSKLAFADVFANLYGTEVHPLFEKSTQMIHNIGKDTGMTPYIMQALNADTPEEAERRIASGMESLGLYASFPAMAKTFKVAVTTHRAALRAKNTAKAFVDSHGGLEEMFKKVPEQIASKLEPNPALSEVGAVGDVSKKLETGASKIELANKAFLDNVDLPTPKTFGNRPKEGLVVAVRDENGDVYIGKKGDIHGTIFDNPKDLGRFKERNMGFVDSNGEFLTRMQASTRMKQVQAELDAFDLPHVNREKASLKLAENLTKKENLFDPTKEQGIHFSKAERTSLSGKHAGTGLKGAEVKRLAELPEDSPIRNRVNVYIAKDGKGLMKGEVGTGSSKHYVDLTKLDILDARLPLPKVILEEVAKLKKEDSWLNQSNAFELAVEKHYNGYVGRGILDGTEGAAVLFGDVKATPARIADIKERMSDPKQVADSLANDDYVVLTADNPAGKTLSYSENKARRDELLKYLDDKGLSYKSTEGQYVTKDRVVARENPVVLHGVSEKEGLEIGKKFGQESVVSKDGLAFSDGTRIKASGKPHEVDPSTFVGSMTKMKFKDGTEKWYSIPLEGQ